MRVTVNPRKIREPTNFAEKAFEYLRAPWCLSGMRKNLLPWTAAFGIAASLAFSSCAYDPYYSSVGGSYSSGYGDGYGYGGSNFSTSLFVNTGDPRWGYDPYSYSYYDYRSRRYYDPYLYGYYPIGYRPPIVYGVPHPYGWRPGSGYCPPPRTVRNVTVVNYRDRERAYRNTNHSWANQVRQRSYSEQRTDGRREESRTGSRFSSRIGSPSYNPGTSYGRDAYTRPESSSRQSWNRSDSNRAYTDPRQSSGNDPRVQNTGRHNRSGETRAESSQPQGRLPSGYNSPVTRPPSIQPESATRGSRNDASRFGRSQHESHQPTARPEFSPRVSRSEGRAQPSREPSVRSRDSSPPPNIQRQERQPQANPTPNPERGEGRRGLRSLGEG
jgi:hypothetical protein